MPKYIIEHLDKGLKTWSLIEYKNISKIVGKNNLIFTNLKKLEANKLKRYGKVLCSSVSKLNLKNSCILDPKATRLLTPKEAKKFKYFIFGGILGDFPRKNRTKFLVNKIKFPLQTRNLGKKQFSTDNAIFVTKQIISGKRLADLKFKNNLEIIKKKGKIQESIILPFCYPLINNKPKISEELLAFLKKKRGF